MNQAFNYSDIERGLNLRIFHDEDKEEVEYTLVNTNTLEKHSLIQNHSKVQALTNNLLDCGELKQVLEYGIDSPTNKISVTIHKDGCIEIAIDIDFGSAVKHYNWKIQLELQGEESKSILIAQGERLFQDEEELRSLNALGLDNMKLVKQVSQKVEEVKKSRIVKPIPIVEIPILIPQWVNDNPEYLNGIFTPVQPEPECSELVSKPIVNPIFKVKLIILQSISLPLPKLMLGISGSPALPIVQHPQDTYYLNLNTGEFHFNSLNSSYGKFYYQANDEVIMEVNQELCLIKYLINGYQVSAPIRYQKMNQLHVYLGAINGISIQFVAK